jgi:hypothetical protein
MMLAELAAVDLAASVAAGTSRCTSLGDGLAIIISTQDLLPISQREGGGNCTSNPAYVHGKSKYLILKELVALTGIEPVFKP